MTFSLEMNLDNHFYNLPVVESLCWKNYDLDKDCDLLVVESLKDPLLNRASAMLSLSWIGHLSADIPTAFFADDVAARIKNDITSIRDRCWLQEKTDVIPLNFIVYKRTTDVDVLVVSYLNGDYCDLDIARTSLGKFLFDEIQSLCFRGFTKMTKLVPELITTQFNFGFSKNGIVKLIGCPGHLNNSVYDEIFIRNFLDFWLTA